MKNKLLKVKCLDDKKFLKFYEATYLNEETGKERLYWFVSRNSQPELAVLSSKIKASAIEAFTFYRDKETGEVVIVFINEFRSALNRSLLGFPAGLVEDGENLIDAFAREISEEVGGVVKHIEIINNMPAPTSAGLTDEANVYAFVELDPDAFTEQHLEETEDIRIMKVPLSKLDITLNVFSGAVTMPAILGANLLRYKYGK